MQLFEGDCLEVMKQLPEGSVDMVLCDLPYGTTACKWDSIIPLDLLWQQYHRLTNANHGASDASGAAMVFTASQPFTTKLISSNYEEFGYCWVWEKEQGVNFLSAKKLPMKVHEDVCVFYRKAPLYNPQMTVGKPYTSGKGNSGEVTGSVTKIQTQNSGTRYPRSVIRINRETGLHPTQKPVALMEYLIRTYTNEGDTVLDNCMGSGTTGVACANTNRVFIGIEQDPKYFQIAKSRIDEALAEFAFFGEK